ncbi:hypothetical protein C7N43_31250 [Sphingobacteriales bacterium UPWRP_1]|nr:hypothetical protein B6N25_08500 [Sphingobacteriales bacterium TSM_CSS]PSJ73024.1 hypothetical protein C7N43_31250 [Sphingobacteriales bacterium UPWRP_1]
MKPQNLALLKRFFTLFLAIQGVLFLLLAINNHFVPLGGYMSWALLVMLFASPTLAVLSILLLWHEKQTAYRVVSVIGFLTALLGIAVIVALFIAIYRFT